MLCVRSDHDHDGVNGMTDIYDQATAREEQDRELALQNLRYSAKPLPQGVCNNCEASCGGAFCDDDCREDYERRERMNKINGRG